jgi:hypothetical protein
MWAAFGLAFFAIGHFVSGAIFVLFAGASLPHPSSSACALPFPSAKF